MINVVIEAIIRKIDYSLSLSQSNIKAFSVAVTEAVNSIPCEPPFVSLWSELAGANSRFDFHDINPVVRELELAREKLAAMLPPEDSEIQETGST